jgi:hypothetical protein
MHNLIEIPTPPTDGRQFIALWIYEGKPWAETRRIKDGIVLILTGLGGDTWTPEEDGTEDHEDTKYFVARDLTPVSSSAPEVDFPPFTD